MFMVLGVPGTVAYFYIQAYEERREYYLEETKRLIQENNILFEVAEILFRKAAVDITPLLRWLYSALDEKKFKHI
jgi:hypothetical protein